jgi:hypothetical protein
MGYVPGVVQLVDPIARASAPPLYVQHAIGRSPPQAFDLHYMDCALA